MNEKRNGNHAPPPGLALNDIYYVLFRHKWKIVILSALGLMAAAGIYFFRGATYQSEAQVWVKYVNSTKPTSPTGSGGQTVEMYDGTESILNTETAILASFDLAKQVATNIGPDKIMAKAGGGSEVLAAAAVVHDNLMVERRPHSPVLRLIYSHPDKDMVQKILQEIVVDYQKRHEDMYKTGDNSYENLMAETQSLKRELDQSEDDLRRAKSTAGISDLADQRKTTSQLMNVIHVDIMKAATELSQHTNALRKLEDSTNRVALALSHGSTNTNALPELTSEQIDAYTDAKEDYLAARKSYFDIRRDFPEHNVLVEERRAKYEKAAEAKTQMEKADPRLSRLKIAAPDSTGAPVKTLADKIADEEDAIAGLQEKIKLLRDDMGQVHAEATNLEALAPNIVELERQVANKETYYRNYLNSLEQAKIDADISSGRSANIESMQAPSPPSLERSKTPKMMGVAAIVGIMVGLVWAFFTELYLDHSVRRPKEIEGSLGMRLFLSIPDVTRNGSRMLGTGKKNRGKSGQPAALPAPAEGETAAPAAAAATTAKLDVAPWDRNHSLHTYNEALRDRLISYFEVNNLNHKPKLVAVTGSEPGSGATTIAAGLAASLSETGDGNVLLIDMNLEHGATQEFYNGKPSCELDTALANETRETAMVQNNLYVVSGKANGDQLSRMLPKRFANLLPKLKASDYDYIIFDMPPIARTGVTQRLAGFMDMMLLVVEAEKTSRDVVKQAGGLLTESKANVSVVLNKTRTYIPKRFHQEF